MANKQCFSKQAPQYGKVNSERGDMAAVNPVWKQYGLEIILKEKMGLHGTQLDSIPKENMMA
jgi:hypothetical protein